MTSIILYSDEPILAQGLKSVLLEAPAYELHVIATNMSALPELVAKQQPDILLIELTSEVTFAALSEIKRAIRNTKVVLWVRGISTELAFQAMQLGVRGILRRTLPAALLIKCLDKVQAGELWFEKALTDSFLGAKQVPLTKREGQLVTVLTQGLKNKEIATALSISEGTVKVYLSRLFQKLGVKDRFELALYGLKNLTAVPGALDGAQIDQPLPTGLRPLPPLRAIMMERGPQPISPTII